MAYGCYGQGRQPPVLHSREFWGTAICPLLLATGHCADSRSSASCPHLPVHVAGLVRRRWLQAAVLPDRLLSLGCRIRCQAGEAPGAGREGGGPVRGAAPAASGAEGAHHARAALVHRRALGCGLCGRPLGEVCPPAGGCFVCLWARCPSVAPDQAAMAASHSHCTFGLMVLSISSWASSLHCCKSWARDLCCLKS